MTSLSTRLLQLRSVTKNYGTLNVLAGIDLAVDAHEVVAIIGPSGSGKSTLLRCINLRGIPDRGRITVEGQPTDAQGGVKTSVGIPDGTRVGAHLVRVCWQATCPLSVALRVVALPTAPTPATSSGPTGGGSTAASSGSTGPTGGTHTSGSSGKRSKSGTGDSTTGSATRR